MKAQAISAYAPADKSIGLMATPFGVMAILGLEASQFPNNEASTGAFKWPSCFAFRLQVLGNTGHPNRSHGQPHGLKPAGHPNGGHGPWHNGHPHRSHVHPDRSPSHPNRSHGQSHGYPNRSHGCYFFAMAGPLEHWPPQQESWPAPWVPTCRPPQQESWPLEH